MRSRANQLWAVGGALAAAALLAVAWFFFISPRNAETSSLRDQTLSAEDQLPTLTHRLNELRLQNAKLAEYQAELNRNRQALPTAPAEPDYIRSLHAAVQNSGAVLTSFTVSGPVKTAVGGGRIAAMPVTLNANGTQEALGTLVDQLQQVQPRAVLVKSSNLQLAGDQRWTLTLETEIYLAPAAADTTAK
jgi:Tfp pilus assembly protein PilO